MVNMIKKIIPTLVLLAVFVSACGGQPEAPEITHCNAFPIQYVRPVVGSAQDNTIATARKPLPNRTPPPA